LNFKPEPAASVAADLIFIQCLKMWMTQTRGSNFAHQIRVARWFIFKSKIPIWVNFGFENVDIFYGQLEYFTDILDILFQFVFILVQFSGFGIAHQEKSGNPAALLRVSN
jgi:hypothetical protein